MVAAKRGIQAGLFEIRLFNDNLGAVLRALGRVLWQNLRYLGYSLVPLAWMALPLTLVIAQLQAFYGYDGLVVGAAGAARSTLRRSPRRARGAPMSLQTPTRAIRVETAAVVLARLRRSVVAHRSDRARRLSRHVVSVAGRR